MANKSQNDDAKIFALLGVLLPIIGYVIYVLAKRGGPYAEYYAKQGVALGIAGLIIAALGMVLAFIPIIGWVAHWALSLAWVVLWIIGIVYSLSNKKQEIPVVGVYGSKF
jgi:uncharacterized membrane protein